jgi:hypothetical protein
MEQPCTACVITGNLLSEVLDKILAERQEFELEKISLTHIKDAKNVPGLEIERFPALLVNGEQITAGSIMSKKQLLKLIDSYR